jgi:hypothetical protein
MNNEQKQNDFDIEKLGMGDSVRTGWTRWLLRILLLLLIVGAAVAIHMAIRDQVGPQDIEKGLVVVDAVSQWVDKESDEPGMVSIVPSIRFRVKNVSDKPLEMLKFIGIFEFIEGGEQIGDGNIPLLEIPLQPGETSPFLTIASRYGYSASSKEAFVKNATEWKPVRVRLLARKNSAPGKLGSFEISREIAGLDVEAVPAPVESSSLVARSVRIEEQVCRWTRKEAAGKHIIYPFARFRLRNISQETLPDLIFRGEFLFADGSVQINADYPALKGGLGADGLSDEVTVRSEYGLEATDLKAFYADRNSWQTVRIKLYAKTAGEEFFLLGTYETVKEIEGVKLVYDRP